MIQLDFKELPEKAAQHLAKLQSKVAREPDFKAKAMKAGSLWDSKNGSKAGQTAFKKIRETLLDMCVGQGLCNYCEQNESNDIEHVYPKSLFPGKTFIWENYLLVCKQCNTAYKLDEFAVFDKNENRLEVPRGTEPPTEKAAFINPRDENPADFMMVNLSTFRFNIMPDLTKKNVWKAEKSIEILQLNARDTLVHQRKEAAKYFYHRLEMLNRIWKADSRAEVGRIITPYDKLFSPKLTLEQVKNHCFSAFKKYIQKHEHPSVWQAIKIVGSKVDPKWVRLFQEMPEVLDW